MTKRLLCPSTMCMDFKNAEQEIRALDEAGVDMFHNDVMDGEFVPNMTLGVNDIRAIRASTNKLIDVHLQMNNPGSKVDWFIDAGADIVFIHPETERFVTKVLRHVKERGKMAGIAISPDVSIESVKEMLNVCDYVIAMTVHPGFAGQKYIESVNPKIDELVKLRETYGFKILVDGNISAARIDELAAKGVDGFILGTSVLFGKGRPYKEIVDELRAAE